MLTILFIFLAAFFKSISDTVADHYPSSIFSNWPKWFSKDWQKQYRVKWPWRYFYTHISDLWHFSNSCMVTMFFLAAITYELPIYIQNDFIMIVALWCTWGFSFEWWYRFWILIK